MLRYLRLMLWPFSLVYRLVVFMRNLLFDLNILKSRSFDIPVIALGNITVGGTGKTPHVEYLVKILHAHCRVAVLSRGYKRKTRNFMIVSRKSNVADVGDEPLQIKRKFPKSSVAVDRNRVHGITRLLDLKRKPEVIILDDAFQHRYVKPGLSILLVDYGRPMHKDMLLPAGDLREPWKNARRADVVIVTKCPDDLNAIERSSLVSRLQIRSTQEIFFTTYAYGNPIPIFQKADHKVRELSYKSVNKSKASVLLVAGIANPAPLRGFLEEKVNLHDAWIYPDHHRFSFRDLKSMSGILRNTGNRIQYIFTTEKDAMRLREIKIRDRKLRKALHYIPVEVQFISGYRKPFVKRISKYLKRYGKAVSL